MASYLTGRKYFIATLQFFFKVLFKNEINFIMGQNSKIVGDIFRQKTRLFQ